ncbi:hypothetical protein DFJ74DRAFT_714835 [Hyaloraphidium curvatum]|nr:hypothetical protein DFJ74DRAFT_714835 [Hyaloraphidium curvatum]
MAFLAALPYVALPELPALPRRARPSLLALRGDDAVVAAASALLAVPLSALRRAHDKAAERADGGDRAEARAAEPDEGALEDAADAAKPRTVSAAAVDFQIVAISLNAPGRLLAVRGERDVAVCVLPRGPLVPATANGQPANGHAKDRSDPDINISQLVDKASALTVGSAGGALDVRSFKVGAWFHSADARARVADVAWWPTSEGGSTLCVLSTDGILRAYNLTASSANPCLQIALLPPTSHLAAPAAAFSIPAPDPADPLPWSGLAVYAVNADGDIYAACPVLPPGEHRLDARALRALAEDPAGDDASKAWARRVLRSSIPHPADPKAVLATVGPLPAPARQGPLRIAPAPPEGNGGTASDIFVADVPPVRYVWTAWTDGRVELCADCGSVGPVFGPPGAAGQAEPSSTALILAGGDDEDMEPETDPNVPPLVLLASVLAAPELASPLLSTASLPRLAPDPLYPDSALLSHAGGLHLLSAPATPAAAPAVLAARLADTRADSGPGNPLLGAAMSSSPLLPRCFVALAAEGGLAGKQLPVRLPAAPAADPVDAGEGWAGLLPGAWKPPGFGAAPAPVRMGRTEGGDAEVLRALAGKVGEMREHLGRVWEAGGEVEERLALQARHRARAEEHLGELRARAEALGPAAALLQERLAALASQQRRLRRRADALLDLVLDAGRGELSREEKEWAREVETETSRAAGFAGDVGTFRNRLALLREESAALAPPAPAPKHAPARRALPPNPYIDSPGAAAVVPSPGGALQRRLDPREVESVRGALASEYVLLSRAAREVERVREAVEALRIEGKQ